MRLVLQEPLRNIETKAHPCTHQAELLAHVVAQAVAQHLLHLLAIDDGGEGDDALRFGTIGDPARGAAGLVAIKIASEAA